MSLRTVAVVPARLASSRYPNKPLAQILGLPMVEHVRRRAALARGLDQVVVATCDQEIADVVQAAGGQVVFTAATHERATERVAEATRHTDAAVVVMVQGDEPLLLPDAIERVVAPLHERPDVSCTNLLSMLDPDERSDADVVKAACDLEGDVLFLTRAPIPFVRSESAAVPVYRQTGIMAFRADLLREFATLPATPLERVESIDMLRLLEHGRRIRGVLTDHPTYGVDRPEDVETVERAMRNDPVQRSLYQATLRS